MRVKTMVVGTRVDKWNGKRGVRAQVVLTVMDMDRDNRLDNMFDYVLTDEELAKPPAVDTVIEPAFGGRLRFKGKVLPVAKWEQTKWNRRTFMCLSRATGSCSDPSPSRVSSALRRADAFKSYRRQDRRGLRRGGGRAGAWARVRWMIRST